MEAVVRRRAEVGLGNAGGGRGVEVNMLARCTGWFGILSCCVIAT